MGCRAFYPVLMQSGLDGIGFLRQDLKPDLFVELMADFLPPPEMGPETSNYSEVTMWANRPYRSC